MPVRRFRSVEQMNQPTFYTPGEPALYRSIAVTWDFGRRSNPRQFSPGVERFRSLDELRAVQDQRDAEYVSALAARRR